MAARAPAAKRRGRWLGLGLGGCIMAVTPMTEGGGSAETRGGGSGVRGVRDNHEGL